MPTRQVIVVGDEKTGKSALIERILHKNFLDDYEPTIIKIHTKEYAYRAKTADLEIVEIGGGVNSSDLRSKYYRDCDFIVICFSLADNSFSKVGNWVTEINRVRPNATKILIGTNGDTSDRTVPFNAVKQFVSVNYINRYYEISSRDDVNIRKLVRNVFIPILFDPDSCDDPHPSDASNFKVCLWGAPGSGKTAFRTTLCGGSSEPTFYSESRAILKLCEKFWNVCIGEQYDGCDELRNVTLDGCNILLVIIDLTDKNSIGRVLSYACPSNFPTVIVGLKSDIYDAEDPSSVDTEDINGLMTATHAILYAEGNACNQNDCNQILEEAMAAALAWYEQQGKSA